MISMCHVFRTSHSSSHWNVLFLCATSSFKMRLYFSNANFFFFIQFSFPKSYKCSFHFLNADFVYVNIFSPKGPLFFMMFFLFLSTHFSQWHFPVLNTFCFSRCLFRNAHFLTLWWSVTLQWSLTFPFLNDQFTFSIHCFHSQFHFLFLKAISIYLNIIFSFMMPTF